MVLRKRAIRERLAKLEEVTSRLASLAGLPADHLRADYRNQWLAERGLELGAQAILDIGNHVLAGAFGAAASTYARIIDDLGAHGVLSADLVARLRGLAGFRNVLTHGYLAVDVDLVFDALRHSERDFSDFQRELDAWLDAR